MVRVFLGLAAIVTWVTLVASSSAAEPATETAPAASVDSGASSKRIGITRADLAASYLRLDKPDFANPPVGERAAALNRAFDRATLAFFTGRSGQAIEQIDAQTESLLVPAVTIADKAAASLKAVVEPAVLNLTAKPAPAAIRVVSLYEPALAVPEEVSLQLEAASGDGQVVWQSPLNLRRGPDVMVDAARYQLQSPRKNWFPVCIASNWCTERPQVHCRTLQCCGGAVARRAACTALAARLKRYRPRRRNWFRPSPPARCAMRF